MCKFSVAKNNKNQNTRILKQQLFPAATVTVLLFWSVTSNIFADWHINIDDFTTYALDKFHQGTWMKITRTLKLHVYILHMYMIYT